MEFHIARSVRERYQFSETLFSYTGNVIFANLDACRAFAHRMNQVRQADINPTLAVHAGSLYAMGLIDEASHVLMARYREQFPDEAAEFVRQARMKDAQLVRDAEDLLRVENSVPGVKPPAPK